MTTGLDHSLDFGVLVSGSANQLTVSAARAMAESAQPPFNPLVIQGGAGLGKTHLLHAVGNLRLEVEPRAVVRLVSWEALVEGWRGARAMGRMEAWLAPLTECGLLLVDHAEQMASGPEGRADILALLEARVTARRATVLGTRRPAAELAQVEPPVSRFLTAGLCVELNPPDTPMRWEILYRRGTLSGTPLAPAVLEEIASLPFDSIQDLVGAANRLIAFQGVSAGPLDPAQARVLITGVMDEPQPDAGVPVPPAEVRPPAEPRPPAGEAADEFGSFLSDVVASVSQQVDQWRGRIADAMLRWQGEGYHTARLQALLDQELATPPEQLLRRFESDIEALRRLQREAADLSPELAADEAFGDPDQLTRAQELLEDARVGELAVWSPQPQFRLEELIEGPSNRLALDAARAIGPATGGGPNPVLIVGESGAGKTHLLHGIGNRLRAAGVRGVVCVSAHNLEVSFEEAADADQLAAWRRRLGWAGALLLDDIHQLADRPALQDAVSGLVDHLLNAGRQVVCTSVQPLSELAGWSAPLLTRLASGVVADLSRPDREVRRGIIRRLLAATEAEADDELADYLAGRPADTVRVVHAVVQRVLRAAESGDAALNTALARQVFETPARAAARPARAGVLGPALGGPRLREKLVEVWPVPRDRLIEDLR
jgi:chromosomal replication initiation ATPase DnaA